MNKTKSESSGAVIEVKGKRIGLIDCKPDSVHFYRWHFCYRMMVLELLGLGDERVERVLDKYKATVLDDGIGIVFPEGTKEKDLPKHIRVKR